MEPPLHVSPLSKAEEQLSGRTCIPSLLYGMGSVGKTTDGMHSARYTRIRKWIGLFPDTCTYDAAQRVEAEDHLRNVASLEEVSGLENLLVGNTVLLDGLLEPVNTHNSSR